MRTTRGSSRTPTVVGAAVAAALTATVALAPAGVPGDPGGSGPGQVPAGHAAVMDACPEPWMPPGFALDGVLVAAEPGAGCAWLAIGLAPERVADRIASEAWRAGAVMFPAADGLHMSCVEGDGFVRFELKDAGDATLVLARRGSGRC